MAPSRRRRRLHPVHGARPDRRLELRPPGGGVEVGVGRFPHRGELALPAAGAPLVAPDRRRAALHPHRAQPGRGARRRHRRGALGLRPEELRTRETGTEQLLHPRPRVLDRRRAGAPVPRHDRQAAHLDRPGHRPTRPRLRRGRCGRALPEPRTREHGAPQHQPRPAGDRRGRHDRGRLPHLRLPAPGQQPPRPRAGLRRPQRRVQVALPHDPSGGRGVRRDLGERLLEDDRQRERLGADGRRPGARLRLPGHQHADQRLLRRPAARRQRVLREPDLRGRRDRRTGLALPDRPPRRLGLRHRLGAEPDRHRRPGEADQGGRPGLEDRLHLRLRPGDRRAGVADRGAARSLGKHGPRREDGEDAAVPDQAAGLRPPGSQRGRPDRLHA